MASVAWQSIVFFRTLGVLGGRIFSLTVRLRDTVLELRRRLGEHLGVAADDLVLVLQGEQMADNRTLLSFEPALTSAVVVVPRRRVKSPTRRQCCSVFRHALKGALWGPALFPLSYRLARPLARCLRQDGDVPVPVPAAAPPPLVR